MNKEKQTTTGFDAGSPDHLRESLVRSVFLVLALLLTGIMSYRFFFDHGWTDAIYMTVITVGTVGFGEVVPLTAAGRMFTSVLILLSLFVFGYAITTISAYLVASYSSTDQKRKKMKEYIQQLTQHVIVCGYGRNGREAVATLLRYGRSVVVIENDEAVIRLLAEDNIPYIAGNATEDAVLELAGIERASHLITSLPADTDNVFIALTARQYNPQLRICSRASEEANLSKLKVAGVNHVVMPDKIGGSHLATLIVSPDLVEFIGNLSSGSAGATLVQEIVLTRHPGVSRLSDLRIKERTGCTVIGYRTDRGDYIINPDMETAVDVNGRIIVLGNNQQIGRLHHEFGE